MSKYKINLETTKDAAKLANIAEKLNIELTLTDGNGMRVNAKSVIGAIYTLEFNEIWLESPEEIPYMDFSEFIVWNVPNAEQNSDGCVPLGQTNLTAAAPKNYGHVEIACVIGKRRLKTIGFLVGVKNTLALKENSGGDLYYAS